MSDIISKFFYPKSVCVIGASTKVKSIGYELLNTMKKYEYKGEVFPVNPKAESILEYSCFPSIDEISAPIDLAILVVPKKFVDESVDHLIKKNVKAFIVVTAGFKETGEEGKNIEKELVEKIKASGGRMVGPNCMGVISTLDDIKLNATFVAEKPEKGHVGFLSQSGALGAAVLNSLRETDIKFAHFISVGNKGDINENDITRYWQGDDNIDVLTYYLESFEDGEEFIKLFAKGEISKPSVILKAGRTESGMKAATSHTGALGSQDKVTEALLKQFGIVRVDDLNELFNTAKGFENFPIPKGKNVAVITNAGGPAILCVDAIEKEGLELTELSDKTKTKLKEIVLPEASVNNPVDLLPGASAELYKQVNEIVCSDENVDAVISIFVEPVMVEPLGVIENVKSVSTTKPIFQVVMPLPEFWQKYRVSKDCHMPLFRNPEDPAKVLANMIFYKNRQNELFKDRSEYDQLFTIVPKKLILFEKGYLPSEDCTKILSKYNLPIINELLLTRNEFDQISDKLYPLVIKGLGKGVVHKSEFNAVKINIKNQKELQNAADEIALDFNAKGIEVTEYLIQPFIEPKQELLVGGFRDPAFGPVVMFGAGGKYVEVVNDTAIRSAYLTKSEAQKMIEETNIGKILMGVRGEEASDINAVANVLLEVSKMMIDYPQITEFDFNPLIVGKNNKLSIVDVRIKWA